MDCPQCGYALTAFDKDCARCRRIAAEEFAKSPAAVWPPAIGDQTPVAPLPPPLRPTPMDEWDNSSGEERGGPPEIEALHWNWGAFFCGWLWCIFHRTFGLAALLIASGLLLAVFTVFILPSGYALPCELMAVVVFGFCCYLGMHGHQMAWERRRFPGGIAQYLAVQRAWAVGGAVASAISLLFSVLIVVFFLAAFRAYEARRQAEYRVAHPPIVSAPVSTAPPPVVLRRPDSQPLNPPLNPPMGRQGYDHPGDYQRRFNPNARRDFDPRFPPSPQNRPGNLPYPAPIPPPESAPPAPEAPTTTAPAGQAPSSGTAPAQAAPTTPPPTAPLTGAPGMAPN